MKDTWFYTRGVDTVAAVCVPYNYEADDNH